MDDQDLSEKKTWTKMWFTVWFQDLRPITYSPGESWVWIPIGVEVLS